MHFSKNILSVAILTSSAVLLSACDGSDSGQSAAPITNTKATAQFSGDLTIKNAQGQSQIIVGRTTDENAEVPAYSVSHNADRAQREILLTYQLNSAAPQNVLVVGYSPDTQQISHIQLQQSLVGTEANAVSNMPYYQPETLDDITLSYDDKTGQSEITFNNKVLAFYAAYVALDNPTIINTSLNNPSPTETARFFVLNGRLKGSLSTAPKNFDDFPKSSNALLTINQQPVSMLNTFYDVQNSSVHFSTLSTDPLNKQKRDFYWVDLRNGTVNSSSHFFYPLLNPVCGINNIVAQADNLPSITSQANDQTISLNFNQSSYNNYNLPSNSACQIATLPSKTLNGSIRLLKPQTQLSISSAEKANTENQIVTFPIQKVELINDNQKILSNGFITIHEINGKIKTVSYIANVPRFNMPGFVVQNGISLIQQVQYHCGKTTSCAGINMGADGFSVDFNNAILTTTEKNANVNRSLTINGKLDYTGR